ncbi:MAG: efflux RND transporter periplasmic adaptor subunit [Phormidesmis sp.]
MKSSQISSDLPSERARGKGKLSDWLGGPRGLMVGLALGLGLAFLAARLAPQQSNSEPATAVDAAQVASASVTTARSQTEPIRELIEASGTVEAFDLLSVSPRASGLQIQSVSVREGDRVSAGQVLAVLDDSVLRAQMQQAEAQVSAARAQVSQAKAEAAENEASLAQAKESLQRYASLYSKGAISAEELTSRRTAVATEEQKVGSAYAAIESAAANVRSRQAEVAQLDTQLSQTQVMAPASGIIAEKTATVGDTAAAGNPLFKIISDDQLELAVKIPQTQLAKITVGTPVQISSDADANLALQGNVRSIDPTLDPQTRQATVKVGLPDSDRLRPGMFLKAGIVTGSRQGVTVPANAVLPQAGGQSSGGFVVYTLTAEGKAQAQTVEIGDRTPATDDTPAKIEIRSGLQANVPVVVEGASYLQDGDLVEVVK